MVEYVVKSALELFSVVGEPRMFLLLVFNTVVLISTIHFEFVDGRASVMLIERGN